MLGGLIAALSLVTSSVLGASLQSDIQTFETIRAHRPLLPNERSRLAQLYFLASDCGKMRKLLIEARRDSGSELERNLLCACDGPCEMGPLGTSASNQQKVFALREFLKNGASLRDKNVRNIWDSVSRDPEAQSIMFQHFRNSQSSIERAFALEQYQALQSLGYSPK